ncbi:AT-rich interactive domain-containing protein 2 [Senna tora]|uniref:AT-rich interactive domain-containing protein 2 n=1 Tax=Senna tora TaxID=362788 RepID=A0A834SWB3_9FABA|nr:AT-rich interactive domain-containing protein 2 [Senna tora]
MYRICNSSAHCMARIVLNFNEDKIWPDSVPICIRMGYKRCLEANEFEDLPFNKAKRFECNNDLVSFADTPSIDFVKPDISAKGEDGFYNIQWFDAFEPETVTEAPCASGKDIETSGHFSCNSSEEDVSGSGATSLSVSSDCLEFGFPQKSNVPLDDAYSLLDNSPRVQVPVGPNHQATIPDWTGRVNKRPVLTGTYNFDLSCPGLVSANNVDDNEEKLMGTSVISMPDSIFYSCKRNAGEKGRTHCNCLDQDSIRCVRQHVREARENLKRTLGHETFVNMGFCDMGEEVSLKWSEEEEDAFHEIVYMNPASLGRNFWKQLSVAFPSRTKKEIVSYYFNVFMLRRRAAQNRSRFHSIDSDDDECHTTNVGFYGFEASDEDDSAIESLNDQDVNVENQENYSEDDVDDDNSDDGTNGNDIGFDVYDKGNSFDTNSQIKSLYDPVQQVDGTLRISKNDFGVQDDSCMSFECQINMDESCAPCGPNASTALETCEFKCDQSPVMPGILDFSSNTLEHVYFSEPCEDDKDWYPGYSTGPASDIDFSSTSNLIEEFLVQVTPDRNTKND